ncbi:non-ribosomal peptide synthetase [Massilia endophytica]|uniref:non-ribosomal peptide synthetase n=1 Tax=Massilia endophytica TaxID=2899220 RepID=UPI001E53A758|nr:non-ribosomal peptide synthetase [Massilia endophytica]UGQ48159.1 amino acid adenylation domain-containing protein [Massilia endophytica]
MAQESLGGLSPAERERLLKLAQAAKLKRKSVDLPPITRASAEERTALSFSQQRLWFLAQLGGASQAYHLPVGLRLRGRLDAAVLQRALDRLAFRHEALRTTFGESGGTAIQHIAEPDQGRLPLAVRDLRGEADTGTAMRQLLAGEAAAPFDLREGPLARALLLQLADEDWALLITQHHIVSDGWSAGVLMKELAALYNAFLAGEADPLPPLELHYADYAAWQRRWIGGDALRQQGLDWQEMLQGAPALLELPLDRPRPPQQDFAGALVPLELDAGLTAALKALARKHGATLHMTLLAGWGLLLARLSGQEEAVVGTPVANRQRGGLEGLLGFFVNTLALRIPARGSVGELLRQVRERSLYAQERQDIPFEQVVDLLRPARQLSHSPLFQAMFSWTPGGGEGPALSGLSAAPLDGLTSHSAKLDLTLSLEERDGRIEGGIEFATALFERASVERFAGHFRTLLAAMAADDGAEVDRLPLLAPEEGARLLAQWNPQQAFADGRCIHELFEEQAARRPQAAALEFEGETLSYQELNARANRLARHLRTLGLGPDVLAGICVERGVEMIVAVLAVLKAGGAYVPLDPAYPAERLAYMLDDSRPAVLLTAAGLGSLFGQRPEGCRLVDLDAPQAWAQQPADNLPAAECGLRPGHLAYIIYTSGSTGAPKGVMIEHANVLRLFRATDAWFGFGENDVWSLFHSYSFDFSVWEIWGALLHGGRLVVVSKQTARSPDDFYSLLCRSGVTVLNQTPTAFRQLIAAQAASGEGHRLRCIVFGGEAFDTGLLPAWYARNPPGQTQLVNMYGITETTVHVSYRPLAPADAARQAASPIGMPIPDLSIYLLDAHRNPVPLGVTGELYVGGAGLARGYLNRPELSAERFLPDPFSGQPGARMYRTGDLGRRLPDGSIDYLGRNDFQLKIRGFRIELGEIESRLLEHPAVREAVVLARGEGGERQLVGYIVPREEGGAEAEALRQFLLQRLPEHMVPAAYVNVAAWPLTANGKLDKDALPAPDGTAFAAAAYEAPRGEAESMLAEVWASVLRTERVGRNDNFFALGGDSIRTLQIIGRARDAGWTVKLEQLFRHQTVASLAAVIERSQAAAPADGWTLSEADRALLPAGVEDAYGLSTLQLGMVFHNQLDQAAGTYHDVFSFHLQVQRWDLDMFRSVLQALAARHPVLRTSFALQGYSEPLQLVHREVELPVEVFDLTALDAAQQDAAIAAWIAAEKVTAFDLAHAPLLRVFVHLRGPDTVQYSLSFHHAILDGWSVAAFQTELFELYGALCTGAAPLQPLAPPAARFSAAVRQEREVLQSQASREFWRAFLAGHTRPELPPRQDDARGAGETVALPIAPALREGLMRLAGELQVPCRTVLLAAHLHVQAMLSGTSDILAGMTTHTRPDDEEGDQVLGLFLNTLPIRLQLPSGSWTSLIRATFEAELQMLPHRAYPYSQLYVENNRSALVETSFNYINFHVYERLNGVAAVRVLNSEAFEKTNFPLVVHAVHHGDSLQISFAFDEARLSWQQVSEFSQYYLSALEAMSARPEAPHSAHRYLSGERRHQVLEQWNATEKAYPRDVLAHQLFEQQAARTPDAVAAVFEESQLSYRELNERANRLAHHLRAQGVGPDVRAGILAGRSLEMVVAVLAVLKAGGAYVPLDPAYPADRLAYMVADSAPAVLLAQSALQELAMGMADGVPVCLLDGDMAWAGQSAANPPADAVGLTPQHLCYLIYTSGSTGMPKGVMIEHAGLCNYLHWALGAYAPVNAVVSSSLSFDATVTSLYLPLLRGGMVHLLREHDEIDGLYALLQQPGADWLVKATPAHLDVLGHRAKREGARTAVGVFVIGGEALAPSTVQLWREVQPGVRMVNEYGPTETVVGCVTYEVPEALESQHAVPIGQPIANTRIYILDAEGQPVPPGVSGELFIGTVGVARGYLNREELNAERFLPDPFSAAPGARMYRTGDLGRWRGDGSIDYLGRNDFQVKIRGFRIEPGEIEAWLKSHALVRDAAVIAREDSPGDKRLVAYYTAGAAVPAEELRAMLAQSLPEHMVPAAYVQLEELPLTPNGKLDRRALPMPEAQAFAAHAYEAPQGELEAALARIWSEVLLIERVGRNDNFFELGGNSLLMVALIERMRQCGLHADLRTLFGAPTLREVAASVGGEAQEAEVPPNLIPEGCSAIVPEMLPLVALSQQEIELVAARVAGGAANVQDIYPLAPLQEGILFHHLMGQQGDVYLLPFMYGFDSRARLDAYLSAMQTVIDRHDILRTAVLWEGLPEPVQVVWRKAQLVVEEVALDPAAGDIAHQMRERFDPRRCRMDVSQAPMLRAHVAWDAPQQRHVLLLWFHHLAGDHTTTDVLHEEIQACLLGRGETLPKALPFRNFVAQSRLRVSREEHEAFFFRMLGDVDEPTAPFGLLDVQRDGSNIADASLPLPTPMAQRLRARARMLGVSAASLFHLAWALVLARLSGRDDVVFGTVLFGRMQGGDGADRVMGLFLNTLPLRLRVDAEGVEQGARAAHALLADLMRHEHASLALAQRCSAVAAPAPLFSSILNFRHAAGSTAPATAEELQAWQGVEAISGGDSTNFPLVLSVDDLGEDFALNVKVLAQIDPGMVCGLVFTALEGIMDALERAPGTPLHFVDVLPPAERQRLLYDCNATGMPLPQERRLHKLFEAQAARSPDSIALRAAGAVLSYAQLDRRANATAGRLLAQGVRPGDRVAICVERGADMVVAMLAVLKAGAAYIPLDPDYPAERTAGILEEAAPAAVLAQPATAGRLPAGAALLYVDASESAQPPAVSGGGADSLAYILYTSGSTGRPKGVMVHHGALVNFLESMRREPGFGPGDRLLAVTSISFDISGLELYLPLLCGGQADIASADEARTPAALIERIASGITVMQATPATWRMLLEAGWQGAPGLTVLCGGEAMPRSLANPLLDRVAALWNLYGPTETTIWSTIERVQRDHAAVAIGRPIGNTSVYVLDRHGRPAPAGVAGELYIGGMGVAQGYWGRQELTAERFVNDPYTTHAGGRLYRTGDLARWRRDGTLDYLGRNDFQIKIRGFRIELGEIEETLLSAPGVREAVVLLREDDPDDKRLVAYYAADADDAAGLRAHLSASLPDYMVPAAYVRLDAMPLTPNGKLDRKALPAPQGGAGRTAGEAPQGEIETALARIWKEVLNVSEVGRHDNFFELGGHSLLAVRLRERMRQEGMTVDIRLLFGTSTLAALAAAIGAPATAVEVPANLIPEQAGNDGDTTDSWELAI